MHVRCPSCAKLYQIDVATIFSSSPHFQCVACATRFSFDFPPANPLDVKTTALVEAAPAVALRKCPRCGSESPQSADECYSCHVIFEKLEGLPLEKSLKAQPSLVRRWKELLDEYTSDERHQDFINACAELDALGFAQAKYEQIRQAQGQDATASEMLNRIAATRAALAAVAETRAMRPEKPAVDAVVAPPNWRKALLFVPYTLSAGLVLWGFTHVGQRNMVGTGIAIALLTLGFATTFSRKPARSRR